MNFIYFGNKIFRKEDFKSSRIEKDKITIVLDTINPLVHKCDSENQAKELMRQLLVDLNQ
jgi:hypothetical protein